MNRILFFDLMIVADKIGARGTRNDMCKGVYSRQMWKKMKVAEKIVKSIHNSESDDQPLSKIVRGNVVGDRG